MRKIFTLENIRTVVLAIASMGWFIAPTEIEYEYTFALYNHRVTKRSKP